MGHRDYIDSRYLWVTILIVGLWFTYWGARNILIGVTAEIEGRIVSAQMTCPQPENSRCETKYIIESTNDGLRTEYIAYAGGLTISHLLHPGSVVSKHIGNLHYEVNGNQIDNFPLINALISICIGFVVIIGALVLRMRIKARGQF